MADWQQGYDLALLKEKAEPYKRSHKPHIYGAFGLIKEREIAEAMRSGNLYEVGKSSAIVSQSDQRRYKYSFSRGISVPQGTFVIEAFAPADEPSGRLLLRQIIEKAPAKAKLEAEGQNKPFQPPVRYPFFVEAFEEDWLSVHCLDAEGFDWIDTRVAAGSELKGFYALNMPSLRPLIDPAELSTLHNISNSWLTYSQQKEALDELKTAGEFAQHYSSYNKRKSWSALSLKGYSDDPSFIIRPDEMNKAWRTANASMLGLTGEYSRLTPLADKCPVLMAIARGIPGEKDRIRLMALAPNGGELTRHADITLKEAGVQDGKIARLHIPLITNERVIFQQWDARGRLLQSHFPVGSLFYLDQRKPHTAVNKGSTERVHLVIDVHSSPELRSWLA